jgi:hypothetical protein
MSIYENLKSFAGLPVVEFKKSGDIKDFSSVAPRVRCEYDNKETLDELLAVLLDQPGAANITALVLGAWMENGESYDVDPGKAIEYLVARKDRLSGLKALFIGDIISEENEISWIGQTDIAPIWGNFPELEEIGVRGSNGLRLSRINHAKLRKLVVQAGGLPKVVVHDALEANAPLEHLELWLGTDDYGGDSSNADLEPLMSGKLFPQLKSLGLCNSVYSDAIAERLATSPLLDRIAVLDLSRGTLTDKGAKALIASGKLGRLESLNIAHHYVSEAMVAELKRAVPNLDATDHQEAEDYDGEAQYYVAVSE